MIAGVIGGLGPAATAYFMELVIRMTDAQCDQDHLEMMIYNSPKIPDRTAYILGESRENPAEPMIAIGRKLAEQGADYISIPCITAHYFHKELTENIPVPIIHAVYETGVEIQRHGIQKVGIMATDGTIQSRIFQKQLEEMGMQGILPDPVYQGYVMDLIFKNVKAGIRADCERFQMVAEHLRNRGAEIIVLGCTELSLIKRDYEIGGGFIDALEVLAQRTVVKGRVMLKREYQDLISI